jgi:hypothetical protein
VLEYTEECALTHYLDSRADIVAAASVESAHSDHHTINTTNEKFSDSEWSRDAGDGVDDDTTNRIVGTAEIGAESAGAVGRVVRGSIASTLTSTLTNTGTDKSTE